MESVRTIWRLRDRHARDASRAVQHMQKALTKMNIQLAHVISDITGVSGQTADLRHEMVRPPRVTLSFQTAAAEALSSRNILRSDLMLGWPCTHRDE